jgi:hypothetical protein
MDDIVVLAPSHWKLRKAVRVVNQTLNGLQLEKHPEKTLSAKSSGGLSFWAITFTQARLPLPKRQLSVSLNVRSSFMSKNRESLAPHPGLARTCNGGVGGSGLGYPRVAGFAHFYLRYCGALAVELARESGLHPTARMLRLASTTPRSRIISSLSVGMAYAEKASPVNLPLC